MAKPRMDLSAFVGKLLEEQDGDVLREGIRVRDRTPPRSGGRFGQESAVCSTRSSSLWQAFRISRTQTGAKISCAARCL
jgi:hypothetical protein